MHDFHSAPPVVVGIDGSVDASSAALWAADEAASRDVPLKLVHVIHHAELPGSGPQDIHADTDQLAAARTALADARRAVEETAPRVTVETEVIWGNPLATLIGLSQSATMVCAGSIGIEHACHHAGSTAAALAGSARCPVAVIHRPPVTSHAGTGYIVAEVDGLAHNWPDDNDVLEWAMAEARLRRASLRVITAGDQGRESGMPAQVRHRIDSWALRYPEVVVESAVVPGSLAQYLVDSADSIQLFVSGVRDRRSFNQPDGTSGCSVLTVGHGNR
ncbi:MAG TPA: universal stress protein [Mycobacterium sp.]